MSYHSVAIDIGGTFTDVSIEAADGHVETFKVSSNPADPAAVVRKVLERVGRAMSETRYVLHGTTVGTNALLERNIPSCVLVTTQGFRDVLEMQRSTSAAPYSIDWTPTPPLVPRDHIFEISERIGANGDVVLPLEELEIERLIEWLTRVRPSSIAVCLLHSYTNPDHEAKIESAIAAAFPDTFVTLSSKVLPERGEYERTSTTAIHAVLRPVLSNYVNSLESAISRDTPARLLVMQSNGGLATASQVIKAPGNAIESGPAAGALHAAVVAKAMGLNRAISLDMGGTTAKACLIEEGRIAETSELRVGGEMHAPGVSSGTSGYVLRGRAVDLTEVGAGGGSLCHVDGQGVLHVGPRSAGARPGPAAYGLGGEIPTVTDAALVLGFLDEGTVSDVHLNRRLARAAIRKHLAEPLGVEPEEAAWLVFQVANSNMMRAIHAVSTGRGRDPANYTLIAFGGGGPTHAAAIAADLGIKQVLIPNAPDCFSAVGLHRCSVLRDVQMPFSVRLDHLDQEAMERAYRDLELRCESEFERDGLPLVSARRMMDVRFVGQDRCLTIDLPADTHENSSTRIRDEFVDAHRLEYGHADGEAGVELVALRLRADAGIGNDALPISVASDSEAAATADVYLGPALGWVATERTTRSALSEGVAYPGPLLIQMAQSTIVVPPDSSVAKDESGQILISVGSRRSNTLRTNTHARAGLKLFSNGLGAVLDRMALTIAQTAHSNTVADAHDFSVAFMDPEGKVVDQGIGIPLHLSSASTAMDAIVSCGLWPLSEGDVVLLNDPFNGGTHLPDLMVIAPVYVSGQLIAHTIAIAHMPDIGSSFTGSWPLGAVSLLQEGLVIPPVKLYIHGEPNSAVFDILRRNVRHVSEVLGDLHSLIAASSIGRSELVKVVADYGTDGCRSLMKELIEYGAERTHAELLELGDAEGKFTDYIDDDGTGVGRLPISVRVRIAGGNAWIDFAGTAAQRPSGVNSTLSSTMSSVHQCIRCLLSPDLPDNSGFYRYVHVSAEPGTVVNATSDMPVASRVIAANRALDALYGAVAQMFPEKMWAAGTSRVALGLSGKYEDGTPYYMTDLYGGSSGARPTGDGVEGVRASGSRNSSIEAQEARYPVRITEYSFASDTGGRGRYRGGNGIRRYWEVLADEAQVVIRPDRHRTAPWALAGGEPGALASVAIVTADGQSDDATEMTLRPVTRGYRVLAQTAGGGGYGDPSHREAESIKRDLRETRVTRGYEK
jgi:5-oxoprolinase (ATP-hydrolysing)